MALLRATEDHQFGKSSQLAARPRRSHRHSTRSNTSGRAHTP